MNQNRTQRRSSRRLVRWAWIYFLYLTGLLKWASKRIAKSRGIIVLTLHRVLDSGDLQFSSSPEGMTVSSPTFRRLLEYLRRHHEVLPLSGQTPSRSKIFSSVRVVVTFDDGWKDTAEIAYPLAKKLDIPFTVFVCPGLAGKSSPFWPEQVNRVWRVASLRPDMSAKFAQICSASPLRKSFSPHAGGQTSLENLIASLKFLPALDRHELVQAFLELETANGSDGKIPELEATMNWEDTVLLAEAGVEIGSHTQHHEILPTLLSGEVRRELQESKREIEERLGGTCRLFAYPNGSWSPQVRQQVMEQGYSQAFVNSPGVWTVNTDPWLIPRVNIWEHSLLGLSGKFSPAVFMYTAFWRSFWEDQKVHAAGS